MKAEVKQEVSDRLDRAELLAGQAISRSQADKRLVAAVEEITEAMRLALNLPRVVPEPQPAPANPIEAAHALDFPVADDPAGGEVPEGEPARV